jgi:hypothetical protein
MDFKEIKQKGMHWVYLAQDMDSWRVLENMVTDIRVP